MTDEELEEPLRDLGPCCVCGKAQDGTVRTLIMLPFEGPRGTSGWGCVVCGLALTGATAIVCDACEAQYPPTGEDDIADHIKWVVSGRYASEGRRVLVRDLTCRPHVHDPKKHSDWEEDYG